MVSRCGCHTLVARTSRYWRIVRATCDPGRAMLGAWQKPEQISCACSGATPTRQRSGSIRIVGR